MMLIMPTMCLLVVPLLCKQSSILCLMKLWVGCSDVNKDWTHKDQDKDQSHKDKDKD